MADVSLRTIIHWPARTCRDLPASHFPSYNRWGNQGPEWLEISLCSPGESLLDLGLFSSLGFLLLLWWFSLGFMGGI